MEIHNTELFSFPFKKETQELFCDLLESISGRTPVSLPVSFPVTFKISLAKAADRPESKVKAGYNPKKDCITLYGREAWNLGAILEHEGKHEWQWSDHDNLFWSTHDILVRLVRYIIEEDNRFEQIRLFKMS